MACPHSDSCPMYELFSLKSLLELWKINFCDSDHERCVRFQRMREGRLVPPNLLPNGKELPLPAPEAQS